MPEVGLGELPMAGLPAEERVASVDSRVEVLPTLEVLAEVFPAGPPPFPP